MADLIRVSKANEDPRAIFRTNTLYSWHHMGKNPELFTKVSGTLFLRLDRLEEMIARNSGRPKGAK